MSYLGNFKYQVAFLYSNYSAGYDGTDSCRLIFKTSPFLWLSGTVTLPYKRQVGFDEDTLMSFDEKGLSDTTLNLYCSLTELFFPTKEWKVQGLKKEKSIVTKAEEKAKSFKTPQFSLSADINLPTGTADKKFQLGYVPINYQLGIGTTQTTVTATYAQMINTFYASLSFAYGMPAENDDEYKFGDWYMVNATTSICLDAKNKLDLVLGYSNMKSRQPDRFFDQEGPPWQMEYLKAGISVEPESGQYFGVTLSQSIVDDDDDEYVSDTGSNIKLESSSKLEEYLYFGMSVQIPTKKGKYPDSFDYSVNLGISYRF